MYKYLIKDIKIFGYHGLYQEEKNDGQFFFISISYNVDNKKTISSIEDVIDYSLVVDRVKNIFLSRRYKLMENLTKDIYNDLKKTFKINSLSIEIKKCNPKIDCKVDYISTFYNG